MTKRSYKLFAKDILEAVEKTEVFIDEMDFDQFQDNDKASSAVLRKLEIIGGAFCLPLFSPSLLSICACRIFLDNHIVFHYNQKMSARRFINNAGMILDRTSFDNRTTFYYMFILSDNRFSMQDFMGGF